MDNCRDRSKTEDLQFDLKKVIEKKLKTMIVIMRFQFLKAFDADVEL